MCAKHIGSGTSYNFAYRLFTQGNDWQTFFDLTSMQALYGPSNVNAPGFSSYNAMISPAPVTVAQGLGADTGGFTVGPVGPITLFSLNGNWFSTFSFCWFVS